MHSFLLINSNQTENMSKLLDETKKRIQRYLPDFNYRINIIAKEIDDKNKVILVYPDLETNRKLIHLYDKDNIVVIIFGELFGLSTNIAKEFHQQYQISHKIDDLMLNNGSFSGVIYDKNSSEYIIFSDSIGGRRSRYYHEKNHLLISPHDFMMTATKIIDLKINYDSLYSSILFEFSLRGRSLLKPIKSHLPNEYVSIKNNRTSKVFCDIFPKNIRTFNQREYKKEIEQIADNKIQLFKSLAVYSKDITVDLTAGTDSRVLAILLSHAVGNKKIVALTQGESNSDEVRYARKVAKTLGIDYKFQKPKFMNPQSFLNHTKLLRLVMNGDTNVQTAVHFYRGYQDYSDLKIGGQTTGPPIYNYCNSLLNILKSPDRISKISKKLLFIEDLTNLKKDFENYLNSYKIRDFNEFETNLIINMHERYGNWGGLLRRTTWRSNEIMPLLHPDFMRFKYKLSNYQFHSYWHYRKLTKQYAPSLYRMSFNGNLFFRYPLYETPILFKINNKLENFIKKINYAKKRINLFRTKQSKGIGKIRSSLFAQEYYQVIKNTLLSNSEISNYLDLSTITKILNQQHNKEVDNLFILGKLLSIEQYLRLLRKSIER